ncbi:MAG: hypothetical protein CL868_04795 [Cytophagaceae bacterium]|nr:hypothetical protein [Cytophagaceae bacterium]
MIFVVACEDNDKAPFPPTENGAFVYVDIESTVIDVTDIANSTYGGVLYAPSENVASHSFSVRRVSEGVASPYAEVYSTTSFPSEFRVGATEISAALGIDVSDILPGDRFDFVGTTVGMDGRVVTFDKLGTDLAGETGQRQAYDLVTFVSCPFVQSDAIGTYTITGDPDGFVLNGQTQFEVIAGENANQIIMVNPFGGNEAYDIAINVSDAGIATIPEQTAFSTLEICCPGFEATRIDGEGFVFSCSGTITFSFGTSITQIGTGAQFTFGSGSFAAQKN